MKRKNYVYLLSLFLIGAATFSGCEFRRIIDTGNIEILVGEHAQAPQSIENPVTLVLEDGPKIDKEAIIQYFCGKSYEELTQDDKFEFLHEDKIFQYEDENMTLYWTGEGFTYTDNREKAGECYQNLLYYAYLENEISNRLLGMYPEEELENCPSEEALKACEPLAVACGYKDAQVNVYAMRKEVMNNYSEETRINVDTFFVNAPDPNYKYVDTRELEKQLEKADKDRNQELANKLQAEINELTGGGGNYFDPEKRIFWTDRTEAYLVIYRSVLNGGLFDTTVYDMVCIYVPSYERVVYADVKSTLVVADTLEAVELITQEEAVEEMLRVLQLDSAEGVTVTGISMVYSPRIEQLETDKTVDPCWRIDYELSQELLRSNHKFDDNDGTIMINAVDGTENHKYGVKPK